MHTLLVRAVVDDVAVCQSSVLTMFTWIHYGSFSSTTKIIIYFFKNQVSVSNKDIQGRELRMGLLRERPPCC